MNDGGHRHRGHANDGLSLEKSEQRDGISGNVSSGVGMSKSRGDTSRDKAQTGNNSSGPSDGRLIDTLSIRQVCFHACNDFVRVGRGDINPDDTVKIRYRVCDARDFDTCWDVNVRLDVDLTRLHGAKSIQIVVARVDGIVEDIKAIGRHLHQCSDISSDGRNTINVERDTVVRGSIDDIEQGRREIGPGLAGVQRVRLD